MGFVPDNGKGGRPAKPRVLDALVATVEREVDRILGAYLDALDTDDHAIRLKAADALLDRAYGRPTQRQEVEMNATLSLDQLLNDEPNKPMNTPIQDAAE